MEEWKEEFTNELNNGEINEKKKTNILKVGGDYVFKITKAVKVKDIQTAYKLKYELNKNWRLDLFMEIANGSSCVWDNEENDIESFIDDLIASLPPREKTIILARYSEKLTLEQAGDLIGCTRERVRQIEAKALRVMKSRAREVRNGKQLQEAMNEYNEKVEEIKRQTTELENLTEQEKMEFHDIEDLNLSVRSYNCLRRAGVKTILDLTEMTEEDLIKVRNLGRKSYKEIVNKMEELGLCLSTNMDRELD